jgi:hypothetical protein
MIPLDEAGSGYYWVQIYDGAESFHQIYITRNEWFIIRIDRENGAGYVNFPKEKNYGRSSCTMKYFKEKVGINISPLFKIEKPD